MFREKDFSQLSMGVEVDGPHFRPLSPAPTGGGFLVLPYFF